MAQVISLVEQQDIDPVFMSRYFERNAERRYASQMLEFMLWRRGKFIPPSLREKTRQQFLAEEISAFYEKGKLNLPQLQFSVTTRCTLRCKNCNAYIPFFGKSAPHVELDVEDFERDMSVLAGVVSTIRRFMLLGGEPLVHPAFHQILAVAAAHDMVGVVEVVTNGTLVPSPELLRIAEEYKHKVYFHISNYSVNSALSPRLKHDTIFAALKERNIKYQMSPALSWVKETPLSEQHCDLDQVKNMFADCWMKRTLEVKNGKIAICPKASSGYELGMANSSAVGEVVDLRGGGDIRGKLIAFYHRDFFEVCRGCVRIDEEVLPAEQM